MMHPSHPPVDERASATALEEPHYDLRLYIAGSLPNSLQAQENLRSLCAAHLEGRFSLEIVDFLAEPRRALEDGVIVTPTLLRISPGPRRMVVGTLADRAAVLHALDLTG
jgi:circadian clock protein KaiB